MASSSPPVPPAPLQGRAVAGAATAADQLPAAARFLARDSSDEAAGRRSLDEAFWRQRTTSPRLGSETPPLPAAGSPTSLVSRARQVCASSLERAAHVGRPLTVG